MLAAQSADIVAQRSASMAQRAEQGHRGMKSLLAVLAPFRKPLVLAALCGFLAGGASLWALRGLSGGGWRPYGVPEVFTYDEAMAARRNARYAVRDLWDFLNHKGGRELASGWWRHLRLDELNLQLAEPSSDALLPPTASDPAVVADVVKRLSRRDVPGLEIQEFVDVRSALSLYAKTLRTSEPPAETAPPSIEPRMATTPQRRYR
jgi:hypothetical protein